MHDHDEYLYFLRRAFDGMLGALEELGDDLGNTAPPLPGANSPTPSRTTASAWPTTGWATWSRDVASPATGPPSSRRRGRTKPAEEVDALFARLEADLRTAPPSASPRNAPPAEFEGPGRPLSVRGVRLHVLEELAQHHGQVQITRDLLRAEEPA
ncbi:DUF664 domain-containing protein [Streptomyces nogalater]